nr:helix-turn-helix transcriptional regulator [Clostridia bacterium]
MLDYEKLHKLIRESDLTLGEIASDSGINRQSLYKKINGEREFRLSEYERLCRCLGLDVSELFVREDDQSI